jgi:lipoate-protein ligase A
VQRLIDEDLLEAVKETGGIRYRFWEPTSALVVLGRSSRAEEEIWEGNCAADGIPIIKRLGGGKSALLSPGMLVISAALESRRFRGHLYYARAINDLIEKSLTCLGVRNIYHKGISDLALNDQKILGCCLYITRARDRWIFFYQGSLLLGPDLSLMERYLKHPPWEPEYRRGRRHQEFLTTLWGQGYRLPLMRAASCLARLLEEGASNIY